MEKNLRKFGIIQPTQRDFSYRVLKYLIRLEMSQLSLRDQSLMGLVVQVNEIAPLEESNFPQLYGAVSPAQIPVLATRWLEVPIGSNFIGFLEGTGRVSIHLNIIDTDTSKTYHFLNACLHLDTKWTLPNGVSLYQQKCSLNKEKLTKLMLFCTKFVLMFFQVIE